MNAIYFLIPLTLFLLAVAIALFFWAVNGRQFEDLERHGSDILFDEEDES